MSGRALASAIVWTPEPGMLKVIVWGPGPPLSASRMAWRREPTPESLVLTTEKVAARAKETASRSRRHHARTRPFWTMTSSE